jgi:predicted nucleotidyltransferase component of viral defense system
MFWGGCLPIYSHPVLCKSFVFKGGTCLKKCYFKNYRFSEDLDFTVIEKDVFNEETLIQIFSSISDWIYSNSGIEIKKKTIRFEKYQNSRGRTSIQGRIYYIGALRQKCNFPKIKIDLAFDEILVLEPATREVYHGYSDPFDYKAVCYSYNEIFSEKLRALIERARPRDLYDIIHLRKSSHLIKDRELLKSTIKQKFAFKKIPFPTMNVVNNHRNKEMLISEWSYMLGHQLSDLKEF